MPVVMDLFSSFSIAGHRATQSKTCPIFSCGHMVNSSNSEVSGKWCGSWAWTFPRGRAWSLAETWVWWTCRQGNIWEMTEQPGERGPRPKLLCGKKWNSVSFKPGLFQVCVTVARATSCLTHCHMHFLTKESTHEQGDFSVPTLSLHKLGWADEIYRSQTSQVPGWKRVT